MEDRYSIIERKSKNIFKAISKVDQRPVIFKKISFSSISAKEKEYIVNQVNTLLRMDYIHILRYLDFQINKRDITVDIAMEFCEGGTLQQILSKMRNQHKKIEEDQVWTIFYQLAQAIDYIHRDKIIHRNINPSNIYFREADRKNIKLGGFSLAKKLDMEEKLSATVLPNTYYLSPEQIETGICTHQTDIWALGCLMYQVCALQSPFKHANQFERVKMIRESKPKKISHYSLQLNRVIFWCLQKNALDRPSLADILGAPEINIRIRKRRYLQKQSQLSVKQKYLQRRQKQLVQKQNQIQQLKDKSKQQSLKKRGSQILSSKNIGYLNRII